MTQAIVINTGFSDSADFIEGFMAHVDEENVVLPSATAVEQGDWVQFHICLVDQSPIFEGMGRCIGAVDNGDDRPAEQRFDLVLDSLQFEGASQVIYEQIIDARQSTSLPSEEPVSLDDQEQDDFTALDDAIDVEVQSDAPPDSTGGYLSRPPMAGSWHPEEPVQTVSSPPPSGLFGYTEGLDFPPKPPRPEPGTYRDVFAAPAPQASEAQAQSTADPDPEFAASDDTLLQAEVDVETSMYEESFGDEESVEGQK
ncbi:MAG: hypothetical protein IPJ88_07430 [Myxococcales bacterium]|nr:MAG: hypothetical protein IPJ88_07430 [Myxococcales bacterium]